MNRVKSGQERAKGHVEAKVPRVHVEVEKNMKNWKHAQTVLVSHSFASEVFTPSSGKGGRGRKGHSVFICVPSQETRFRGR